MGEFTAHTVSHVRRLRQPVTNWSSATVGRRSRWSVRLIATRGPEFRRQIKISHHYVAKYGGGYLLICFIFRLGCPA